MSSLSARLERLERTRPATPQPDLIAESAEYGELVDCGDGTRAYLGQAGDGRTLSTMVLDAPDGSTVAYQLVGVDMRDLV